jgi:hypothetical protein
MSSWLNTFSLFNFKVNLYPFDPASGPAPAADAIYVNPCVYTTLTGISISLKEGCTKAEVQWPVFTSTHSCHVLSHAGLTRIERAVPFLMMSAAKQKIKGKSDESYAGFKATSSRSFVSKAECVPSLVEPSTIVFKEGNYSNTGRLVVKSYSYTSTSNTLKVQFENHAPVDLDSARQEKFVVSLSFPFKVSTAFNGSVEDGIFFSAHGKCIVAVPRRFEHPWADSDGLGASVSESPERRYKFLVFANCENAAALFSPV